jgi:hypothetical protein
MGVTHPPVSSTDKQRKELAAPHSVVVDVRPVKMNLCAAGVGGYPAFPPMECAAYSSMSEPPFQTILVSPIHHTTELCRLH